MPEDYPINEDYITQCTPDIFKLARDAVQLAVISLRHTDTRTEEYTLALRVLKQYGEWKQITSLPRSIKQALWIEEYGEEEVTAMLEQGMICASCSNTIPPQDHLKYRHRSAHKYLCVTCASPRRWN